MSDATVENVEMTKEQKIAKAKELYSKGSRNFLVKSYDEAADQLSQVCALYEELYGELCDELGMPYLLYAKSLIALSLEENKVLDVQDEQMEDVEEEDEPLLSEDNKENDDSKTNGELENNTGNGPEVEAGESSKIENGAETPEEVAATFDENEAEDSTTNLQLAWETLEFASRIFSRQGLNALPNLAEVHTELGNIQFENQILDEARGDYEKALQIYSQLPSTYSRATAEIHYKIGLTFLMQQMNDEGANELEKAGALIDAEIQDIKRKPELSEKDENNIKDMEEIKQEIIAKVQEIKETKQQTIDVVRAALDNFMSAVPKSSGEAGTSSQEGSSQSAKNAAKATDISHLIKRKKPEDADADSTIHSSPAKKPTTESI